MHKLIEFNALIKRQFMETLRAHLKYVEKFFPFRVNAFSCLIA